jgi:hypothetical protein
MANFNIILVDFTREAIHTGSAKYGKLGIAGRSLFNSHACLRQLRSNSTRMNSASDHTEFFEELAVG